MAPPAAEGAARPKAEVRDLVKICKRRGRLRSGGASNISVPLIAWPTDAIVLRSDKPLPRGELIYPRTEPETIFLMRERLAGSGLRLPRSPP
jgi:hypothetical protein